jgi:two-component system chemotaxis response regulator CheY
MTKTCLVVDDSKVVRKFARGMLEELSLSVREAGDGKEALEACADKLPDMILLDWNMPVMDGITFLKEFRKNTANSKVIVIFCTTENDMSHIQMGIGAGANEYIMKPFDKEILRTKLVQTGVIAS